MRVMVTDGDERAALALVRSLGRGGHSVVVAASGRMSLAGSSRFADETVRVPDPLTRPDEALEALRAATTRHGIDALIPVTDALLGPVLANRRAFESQGVLIPFASEDAYAAISNKQLTMERAREVGVDVPQQIVLRSRAELDPVIADIAYPVVVKPSRSVVGAGASRSKTRVAYARNAAQLRSALVDLPAAAFPVLLQQRIDGPGVGMFLLVWEGRTIAAFAHRRLREKPPSGGVSVLRESRPVPPELLRKSEALLARFSWEGPAMVEYKVDAATGREYLMEINGRYWGSLQLAIDAGVDFPVLHLAAAGGAALPQVDYHPGVKTRWLLGDLDHLLTRLRRDRHALDLPADAPGRGRVALDFLTAFRPGIHNEVFRVSDPLPAVTEAASWLARLV